MRALLTVDTKALKHNVTVLSRLSGNKTFFCPMIKANAYGHGDRALARALKSFGVKKLGVVSVEEALRIKNLAPEMAIYIFGPFEKSEIRFLKSGPFIPVVGQWKDLKNLCLVKKIPFHIKFNLGMNRLGFDFSEKTALIKYIKATPGLSLKGVCAHLSEGEKAGLEGAGRQAGELSLFKKICPEFQNHFSGLQFHLLNSAGWLSVWSHSKWSPNLGFRPGISLYGIKPPVVFADEKAKQTYESVKLKPVSCLKSFVVQSRLVLPGQTVSYGKTWRAKKKSAIAVVSLGYADGLPYSLSGRGAKVLFRGKKVPITGRICMDFLIVDLTNALNKEPAKKGEEVVIFGSQGKSFISLEEQAKKARSTPYELFTRLGNRVRRVFSPAVE